jgi:catechol 2,3-dioxygenase-like lactoylglutathione lyase family enzyme
MPPTSKLTVKAASTPAFKPTFEGGLNIAMKIPKARYDETVAFYRDALGMDVTDQTGAAGVVDAVPRSASVQFGPITLWLDMVENYARSDLWLEVFTNDVDEAITHLAANGIATIDELEPLPTGMNAHWISNPSGVTHLIRRPDDPAAEA